MTKNVLIFQRRLTSYRVPLFEALKGKLESHGVQLNVVYGAPKTSEVARQDSGQLAWGIEVPRRYFNLFGTDLVWHRLTRNILENSDLIILPHEGALLANYPILLKRMLGKQKIAFWGHGDNFQANGCRLRDNFKNWLSRQADWWFAYTEMSVKKVETSGFPGAKITCLDNSIDISSLQKWRDELTKDERCALLKQLRLQGYHLGVYLGGLIEEKRLNFLMSAADGIKEKLPDFELLIIGDGSQRDFIRDEVAKRPWSRWVGALHGKEKVKYMSLGKLMLNPGLVGLGILDSFVFGVPMVTTDCDIHSPEIAYLENNKNGLMTDNDIPSYVNAVVGILMNDERRKRLSENCLNDAQKYTLENMTDNFCNGILSALESDS